MLDASASALLSDLERRLDARAFRVAARLGHRWQERRRASRAGSGFAPSPPRERDPVSALEQAFTAGALETAATLVEQVLAAPDALDRAGPAGQALALEVLLMLGDRPRAAALAAKHAATLASSVEGAAVLELVGSRVAPDVLPDGRPHLLRLSRRLERGELTAADLVRQLGPRPFAFLRSPELHLLCFSALATTEPERALPFLNRFLALHDSPAARWSGEGRQVLERLSFASPRRATVKGPLVSVLLPAFNASETIGYAVDSLLNQSYSPLEILVGDDASEDDTLEVLRRRAASEPRLRLFRSLRNQGPYNVKNALMRHARGELVTFHDADDLALPDRIARQVEALRAPGSVACIANFARIRPSGSFVFFKDQRAVRLAMVTLMLKRQAFDAVGPFRSARVGADLELYTALRTRFGPAAVARLRSPVMLGLWSPGSATQGAGTESLEDGYRSPARRAYSELVARLSRASAHRPGPDAMASRLRETGNIASASELTVVS